MCDKIKPVIVTPAYNRPEALSRLLKSIAAATYPKGVKLYISLEGGASEKVNKIARDFFPTNLKSEVIQRESRLGLRKHIIACGDMALVHGSVIVLEDDLLVDRYFYHYAQSALKYYDEEPSVAGISLYAQEYNEYANLPFKPMVSGYSTYPIQIPCSWGQCWLAKQWKSFKTWYVGTDKKTVEETVGLPDVVKRWPESSWKKYFAAYLVRKNLNFIYPYQTYTTNCSDAGGTHISIGSDIYQVSFASQNRLLPNFNFCSVVNEAEIAYDAFLEPCGALVYRQICMNKNVLEIDTLGIKSVDYLRQKQYVLTCRLTKNSIQQYPRCYRPIEQNLLHQLNNNNNNNNVFALTESIDIVNKRIYKRNLTEYSYYSGINFETWQVIKEIFKAMPALIYKRILQKISNP